MISRYLWYGCVVWSVFSYSAFTQQACTRVHTDSSLGDTIGVQADTFSNSSPTSDQDGRVVRILFVDRKEMRGELIRVRESSLVLLVPGRPDQTPQELEIQRREIERVVVEGESKILQGMGTAIAAGAGAVIGLTSGNDPPGTFIRLNVGDKALPGGILLGGAAIVVGTLAGILSSSSTEFLDLHRDEDFESLKQYSKYRSVVAEGHRMRQ